MMKTKIALVAMIAILVSGATAMAQIADHAWFSLESTTGGATATEGPGLALEILNAIPGEVLTIGYNFTSDHFPPMASWGINIDSSAGNFGNPTFTGLTGYNSDFDISSGPTNLHVGQTSATETGAAGLAFTFDLTVANVGDVTGDFGGPGQLYHGGFLWYGFVGPNPISYAGYPGISFPDVTPGWGSLPVVTVSMVPEPSTFSLLVFGSFMILRRRRVGNT